MASDPLKDYPGYSLRRASSVTMADFGKRLTKLRLRPTEATVLLFIEANPNITQSEIGRLLDIASANMAPLVSRLEERDLIAREPVDGRSHGLTLSAAGKRLAEQIKQVVAAHEAALLARVPAKFQRAFLEALHAIWSDTPTD